MNLVLSTCLFKTNSLPKLFPILREAGFNQLEVMDRGDLDPKMAVLNDIAAESRANDIEIPNWHLLMESTFKKTHKVRKRAVNRIKHSMDKGKTIGAKNHVLQWYHRFQDRSCDDLWRHIVDDLVNHADNLGIRLLMETVPDKPKNERYVSSSEIIDFVRNYPPEVLSKCVDVNHSNLKENLPEVVHRVKDRLVSLQVSDNDGHSEKHWLPGQGVIDFGILFESLETIQFNGMIVLEVIPWCKTLHTLPEVKRLYEFGKTLLETKRPHLETPVLANT